MKTIQLFIAFSLLSYVTSNAQITKGNWMVGGNLGFDYSKIDNKNSNSSGTTIDYTEEGSYNLKIEPNVAYFFKDKFAIGTSVSYVNGFTEGLQLSAVSNTVNGSLRGFQMTGVLNAVRKETQGLQLSAVGNVAMKSMRGLQLSGVFNYAKHNKGLQLGLINLADTSTGVSLGLINIVKHGYHKLSVSSNDLINANVSFKSGNANLYTIFMLGKNFVDNENIETFGLGLGHDFFAGRRFSLSTELTAQQLHLGRWDYANILNKFHLNFQLRLFKGFSVYGGPVFNYYVTEAPNDYVVASGYKSQIAPSNSKKINGNKAWLGWSAGFTLF